MMLRNRIIFSKIRDLQIFMSKTLTKNLSYNTGFYTDYPLNKLAHFFETLTNCNFK